MTPDITTPNTTTPANLKAMIEHDELLVAVDFAKRLPDGHPDRMLVEEHSGHLASPEAYRDYYRTMRGEPCPEEHVFRRHEQIKRFSVIRRRIVERGHKTVLDLGCLDGWQLLNLAATGVTGVGVDLCPEALAVAQERASKWGFRLLFMESSIEDFAMLVPADQSPIEHPGQMRCVVKTQQFDAVILSEVLEHVLDPAACFKTAVKHLAPGGIIYVSVPATPIPHHGKIEDAREHLRIYTEADLVGLAKEAGLERVVDHELIEETDEGEKFANRTISFRRATATIYCNHVTGGWSPERLDELGGSEEMVVKVAEAWARQGYEVTVHQNGFVPTDALLRDYLGVRYRSRSASPASDQDLLVLFKGLDHLGVPAGRTVFWTTDLPAEGASAAFLPPAQSTRLDAVLCISEYHRTELLKACPWLDPTKVKAHWLGVDEEELGRAREAVGPDQVEGRVIYASSYDRGLGTLLDLWPTVRKAVPHAELRVAYGFDFWKRSEAVVPAPVAESMRQERMRLENLLVQPGVVHLRRLPRGEFLKELASAAVWAYPCTGGELCCKTALEAQLLGTYPVVVPTMALAETVQIGSKVPMDRFVDELIRVLTERPVPSGGFTVPGWGDLAKWVWTESGADEGNRQPVGIERGAEEPASDVGVVEPEQFVIPSRVAVPPTGLDLLFMVNGMPFDGNTDREKSLGGSETAALQLCRELAKRGHRVTVFSNLPGQPGKFDGVGYLPIQEWGRYAGSTPHDVSIIQRDPSPVSMPLASKMNVIWCHDLGLLRYRLRFRAALWNVDYLAPVSHWHGAQLKSVYDLPSAVIAPMRNGIELAAIQRSLDHKVPRDRKALVYAARPERGLDLLLQTVFPRLLERDPKLTLYIAGYDNTVPEMRDFYAHCQQLIANLGQRAKWMGHLKKAELYALYSRARAYVYPTRNFREVSCITAQEAAACGLPFVASTLGALPETTSRVPGFARLVEHTGQADEAFISRFVEAAWEVLSDDLLNKRMSEAGRAGAEAYSWVEVAKEWEDFLLGALEVRSASKVRLARHWWRIGDLRGVELALKHNGEEPLVRDLAEKLRGIEDDEPPVPQRNVLEAMAQMASEAKPKTILGIGPQMADAARTVAGLLGVRAVTEPPADFVFGVETLDCAADPSAHIREAEALAAPGGLVCLGVAGLGTYQDRVHQATMATHRRTGERRRRWVFDNHDLRDLLGKRPDLLAMVVGGGTASEYDGVPTAWSLFRFRANNGPVGELDVARRLWLQAPRMSLSGCLIVKNAEDMLHRCLKSILPYCDEVVVDDNGSTDSTFEVLAQYGIVPAKGPSPIDMGFDAARNANIARATGDMVLWIDADEALLDGRQLPKYLRQNFFNGYGVAQHHFSAVPPNAFKPDMPVRLYRRLYVDGTPTGIRFFGCVAGETLISTPSGQKPIRTLVGTRPWVYCYDHSKQRISLAKADWIGKTRRNVKVLEIELDDGTTIRATEEHPFLLRKAWKNVEPGAYVPAKDLKPGDRLMPFYRWQDGRKIGTPRGWMVALSGTALQQDEHRFVYEEVVSLIPPKHDVHHVDENPANNDPSNLEALPEGDHTRLHHLGAKRSDETRRRVSENHAPCDGPNNSMWGRIHLAETRRKIGEKSRARGAGYGNSERGWFTASRVRRLNKQTWADPDIRARRIAGIKAAIVRRQAATIPSNNHKVAAVRDGGFADVYNIEMPGPNHNFVAGGVVVHNCVHEHPELGINQSVGPSIVVSDVHIAHDGYLTETGRRKRFERNIPLMMRDRAAYPDRLLGKFLMVRDWVHLARYELERNGRRLTPQAAAYLESAVEAYRKDFLGRTHMMAMDGLAYYNEALQHLGRGFETQAVVKVGGLDGMSHDFAYSGRVASQEDLQTMLGGASRDLTEVWKGDYV